MPKKEIFRRFSKVRNAIALRTFDFFPAAVEEFAPAGFPRHRLFQAGHDIGNIAGKRRAGSFAGRTFAKHLFLQFGSYSRIKVRTRSHDSNNLQPQSCPLSEPVRPTSRSS